MAGKIRRYRAAKIKKPITFVYFDIGGVLLNYSRSIVNLAKALNAPMEEVQYFWEKHDDALNRGVLTGSEFWRQIKTHFSYRGRDIDFVNLWISSFRRITESHTFARKISRTHKVGILSNIMPEIIHKATVLGHIPRVKFIVVIESHVLGIAKPNPEIFAIAQKHAGVAAGKILFIDDKEINVRQAHLSGFHTYHFDTDHPAASVAELEKLLIP